MILTSTMYMLLVFTKGGQPSVGESQRWWLYNGLPERDLLELMSQLSDAKCNVKKLE